MEDDRRPLEGVFTCLGSASMAPPLWVIKNLLPVGITFMAGPAKSYKSLQALAMSLLVAKVPNEALPVNMREVERTGIAMLFSAEADAGTIRHTAEVGIGVAVPADSRVLVADDPWEWRLDDEDGPQRLLDWANERGVRLLVIDPLRDYHALEEKDDGGMNRLLRPIQRWATVHNAAALIIHHTKKKGRDEGDYNALDMRGTSALFAIADGVLMITPRGGGTLHMTATFKRGEGWERDIRLGVWGKKAEGGVVTLSNNAVRVWEALSNGARDYHQIALQLTVSKATVVLAVKELEAMGALRKEGRTLRLAAHGSAIVKQATSATNATSGGKQ